MDDRERQEKNEERTEPPAPEEAIEDMDVPEGESEDVKGGYYSFKQGWPKKYEGS